MEERYHIPLVLCCAEENEVALVRVVHELHKEGRAPEVVAGVDVDVDLLARAVDRTDGPALFVLCQTDELDRNATRRLAGLFSARKAPEHRIVTVQLTPARPMSILPPIRTALKELIRTQYERDGDGGEDREFMRDVVGPTPVTAVDRKGPDPEELARRLHQEMVAAEALLDRRSKGVKPRGAGRTEAIEERRGARSRPAAAAALRRPTPEVAYAGEPGAPQQQMEPEEAGLPSMMPDLERVPEVVLATRSPDTVQTDFTPTEAKLKRRTPAADPSPRAVSEHAEDRPGSRVLLFVAIAGITALALMAVLHMSGDGRDGVDAKQRDGARGSDEGKGGARASAEGGASAGAAEGGAKADEGGAAEGAKAAEGGAAEGGASAAEGGGAAAEGGGAAAEGGGAAAEGGALAAEGGAAEGGASAAEGGGEGASAAEDGESADAAEGGPDEADDDGGKPLVPPPPPSDGEALVIDHAIAEGKIRSLDTLLVLKVFGGAMTWDEANNICRGRTVANIRGWHLPSTFEVKRLRRSRMLGGTTYWTRSRNAAKDEAFALDSRTGRVNLYLTVERVAEPICVRAR